MARDLATMRGQMDATSQELRNQIRDQLQAVYDRGDKQTRDWVAALSAGLKDVSTVRRERWRPRSPRAPKRSTKSIPETTGETLNGRSMRVRSQFRPGKLNFATAQAAARP